MMILVRLLPNSRTTAPRDNVEKLSVMKKSRQHHYMLFLTSGDIGLVLQQQLHHHSIVVVHCRWICKSLNTAGEAHKGGWQPRLVVGWMGGESAVGRWSVATLVYGG
jgi:hypothetical protein